MKVGDLVVTTRAQIGIPAGATGLVIKVCTFRPENVVSTVQLLGTFTPGIHARRFLSRDLEVINESR